MKVYNPTNQKIVDLSEYSIIELRNMHRLVKLNMRRIAIETVFSQYGRDCYKCIEAIKLMIYKREGEIK